MLAVTDQSPGLSSIAILIPAWKPEISLLDLLQSLHHYGFGAIVRVDDGSGPALKSLLQEVGTLPKVQVVTHAINLGKGRALKTGFNHCLNNLPQCTGVVTADADGQHSPLDIVRVAKALSSSGRHIVLGSRLFVKDVPLRSRFGNSLTRILFGLITGAKLLDTQTGLRAFPRTILPELMTLDGERYEYEMSVLAHVCRNGEKPIEIPIETWLARSFVPVGLLV